MWIRTMTSSLRLIFSKYPVKMQDIIWSCKFDRFKIMNRFIKELHAKLAIQYPEKPQKEHVDWFFGSSKETKKLTLQV